MKTILTLAATAVLTAGVFAQEAPAPADVAPTTAPTTNPAEAAAVKDALAKYNAAVESGNVDQIIDSIATSNETQQKALKLMGGLTSASAELYKATKEKFGEEKLQAEGVDKSAFQGAFPELPVDRLQVNVSGETAALITPDGQPLPFTLVKKDGTWKIDGSFLQFTEQQLADQTKILDAVVGAFNSTREDVVAGHVRSPDEVLVLMQHRAQKAARAIQMQQIEEAMKKAATQPAATQPTEIPADIMAP